MRHIDKIGYLSGMRDEVMFEEDVSRIASRVGTKLSGSMGCLPVTKNE
jgi:hypothetical protein